MTFAWYPPACYDRNLEDEFLSLDDWEWYSTEKLKLVDRLPGDAVLRGDFRKAFMNMTYHKPHCLYPC